ncbi:MAG: CotH kinase family protein [Crocinitomicaceae bacterium]
MRTFLLFSLLSLSLGATAQLLTDSNLPIVVVTTENGVPVPDDPRIVAHMGVIDNGAGNINNVNDPFTTYDGRISIEIRGSTSQQYPKKGYGLETQDSLGNNANVALLGMGVENDWILYGPYTDKTLIRNVLTFDLARKMGNYASDTRYCELMLNGDYRGIYVMMERIKQDNDRVDIEELHVPNQWNDTLTGGYIVKVDKLTGDVPYSWDSNYDNEVVFQFHDPEWDEINSFQASYMEDFIGEFEDVIYGPDFNDPANGWPKYIDHTSFFDFFILQELGRTVDGYRSSSFMFKNKNTFNWQAKLNAGPMWDFNLSFGNADYCDAEITSGWQYEFDQICNFSTEIPFWWERLLEDPGYANGLRCRWEELRQGPLKTSTIHAYIDSVANHLEEARIRNFQRWPIIGVYVNWNAFVGQTYQQDLNFLKNFIFQRALWLDYNMPGDCSLSTETIEPDPVYHRVWPNPIGDQFSIGFSLFQEGDVVIEIIDLSGRIIQQNQLGFKTGGAHAVNIDSSSLIAGNYIYSIKCEGKTVYTGKLIKE